jgi:hypothetical protein
MNNKDKRKEIFELFESRGIDIDRVLAESQKAKAKE